MASGVQAEAITLRSLPRCGVRAARSGEGARLHCRRHFVAYPGESAFVAFSIARSIRWYYDLFRWTLAAVGTVVGFTGAIFVSRALSSLTTEMARAFGQSTGDPVLLIGAPLLLAGLAILACYIPARKSDRS